MYAKLVFLQETFTPLVHAHAGRTQKNQANRKKRAAFRVGLFWRYIY